ncbi:hypothetical protein Har1130_17680 [Haloarcula sp. CBA1130]|uniref:hypothetical protein n=1 Tax=unclassified Haloarcula TaxID=2624677 RepID=UPI0012452048|nr:MULTISPECIES: hypothetical protein [unclassified Haloarcula]KAA9396495.1 hypothetical protein Har1130_17680 [Haloarcula sp. CBA1130]KAA9397648.1 hypothetical protein Har1129_05125 [Haloarcula sp. CBA1129]
MPSIIQDTVFKEPTGGILALIYLAGALLFIGQYGYYAIIANSAPGNFALFLGAGFGLSGIAESLPKHQRRAAGVLRLAAVIVLTGLLAAIAFAPEFLSL